MKNISRRGYNYILSQLPPGIDEMAFLPLSPGMWKKTLTDGYRTGSPGSFNSNSWGAPTGERWADSAPPMRPAQGYGGPPPLPYGGIDAQMDMQGPPYMPSQGAG